ncbi:class I SAM-dependent methyltransferase [Aquimarina sp. 2201CG5-10]|uniref:class I SAM-dependent methyltransferase n=1 Tax=Aquimarina callyspongiae TaxID=3098150 RepID=UPI002AB3EC87|nr:class I SAM-dependent methyltransferase [Aquimarina sp. 2201CG5-10]MDY8135860.1 class I SAM-dependent methyltransferase [Aquimarina sp. 2201CG5-10]
MSKRFKLLFFSIFFMMIEIGYSQYKKSDWKERDEWMNVPEIFKLADIKPGINVADIGCHEGYLTVHLAKEVGNSGKVYAVDVREDRINKLDEYLKDHKLLNVKTILGDYDNPKLPEKLLDAVIIMDTYHEMSDYMIILAHVKRSLKPNGKIIIIEKFKEHMANKSREAQVDAHTLALKYVKAELQEAGYMITDEIKDFGRWKNEPEKRIWVLVASL